MSTPIRLEPSRPLPSYIFIPGLNPHPKKSGGHMEGEEDPKADPIDPASPEKNKFFRYALDLYNYQYYWESHVYFEALWNAHHRQGSIAEFLKGLIKLGAAGVKFTLHQDEAARGHIERANELFELVRKLEGDSFLGFDLNAFIQNRPKVILPEWK